MCGGREVNFHCCCWAIAVNTTVRVCVYKCMFSCVGKYVMPNDIIITRVVG